jgi:molecular chaperone GrpE
MDENKTDPSGAAGAKGIETLFEQDPRALAQERDKYQDLYLRTQAEFDNYQKRNRRELETERQYALTPLARELLPIIDNLDRALAAAKEAGPLIQGVRLVQTQLLEALKRHHIRPIEAVGKPFDPNQHEAVMQQLAADKPPNTVLQVLEQGYTYRDRVLRPAKVIVSKPAD